ncbi:MAG: phage virion morphogenesis protein [Arenicellales bacterium]
MSGVAINIEAEFKPIYEVFDNMIEAGLDTGELMDMVGLEMVGSTVDRFRTSTAPDGSAWKPVKRGGTPLVDQGLLRGSITHLHDQDEVEWGTNSIYGAIHQFGGQAGRNHAVTIDARPYVGVSDDDEELIQDVAYDFLEDIHS